MPGPSCTVDPMRISPLHTFFKLATPSLKWSQWPQNGPVVTVTSSLALRLSEDDAV